MTATVQAAWLTCLAIVACAQLGLAQASSGTRRVALVNPGAELEHAARAALEPWQVEVVVVASSTPSATVPSAHAAAREIALTYACETVVWVSEHAGAHALWIYERSAENAFARPLATSPPFDGASAAALALTIKTLLRHSATAPESERYGARPSPVPQPEPVSQPARAPAQAAPSGADRAPQPRAVAAGPSQLEFDASAGIRFGFAGADVRESRIGIGISWWPRGSFAGLALRLAAGPALALQGPLFRGVLTDIGAGLFGRLRKDLVRWLRVVGALGACADFTILDGVTRVDTQASAQRLRVVPSLALELGLEWLLTPWLRLGLRGSASWLLLTQRYTVLGEPVVELSRFPLEGALVLGFGYYNGL